MPHLETFIWFAKDQWIDPQRASIDLSHLVLWGRRGKIKTNRLMTLLAAAYQEFSGFCGEDPKLLGRIFFFFLSLADIYRYDERKTWKRMRGGSVIGYATYG